MSSTQAIQKAATSIEQSLVRYVEVWAPNHDGSCLVRSSSRCVDSTAGNKASVAVPATVQPGEGLVGAAWQQMAALIVDGIDPLWESSEPDCTDALAAKVAIPIFQQQQVRGVVVLGLGTGYGAAEVWSRDDRDELSMTSGHYSGLESFEFITQYTRFPKGAGVPGNVWKTGELQMAQNLETSAAFVRSFGNDPAVISSAVGIPISASRGFASSVLLLMEATDCPLASRTTLWAIDDAQIQTSCSIGDSQVSSIEAWERQVVALVSDAKGPLIVDAASGLLPAHTSFDLAIPIFNRTRMTGVLNFMF